MKAINLIQTKQTVFELQIGFVTVGVVFEFDQLWHFATFYDDDDPQYIPSNSFDTYGELHNHILKCTT